MKLIAVACLVLAGSALFAMGQATSASEKDKSCGPPNYCARTDQRIEPYPKTPPVLGPAGSIIADPSFGSRIVRITDAKSDPQGRKRSLMTPSSAEQNSWNVDSTKFYIVTAGGQYMLYRFDPSTLKVHQDQVLPVPWQGEPDFSYTRPNVIYGVRRNNPAIQEYDTSNGKAARINLASDCLKLNASDFGHSVSVSADDDRWSTMLGPAQDENPLIYVYDRKLGCRWYNTLTGTVGGQWGPKGAVSVPDRCTLHNAKMSKSGEFIWLACGAHITRSGWLVWEVATANVLACAARCSGHHALGYSHVVGPSGEKHPLDLLVRNLNRLRSSTQLVPDLQPTISARYWYDSHLSWNYANPQDTTPVCLSTYGGSNPNTPGAPLDTIAPWENEILCVETDGKSSNIWRFAHTYSTANNGFWSTPRGNVSQDGRFFMFTSDWQDQLGYSSENKQYRTDVFVVELH